MADDCIGCYLLMRQSLGRLGSSSPHKHDAILPGTDGLLHISQLADERVASVTDVVKEGDEIPVKVLEVDRQGKIRLSLKEARRDLEESNA